MDRCRITNTYKLIDDHQRKMIADEAERLATSLPLTSIRRIYGRTGCSKDLVVRVVTLRNHHHPLLETCSRRQSICREISKIVGNGFDPSPLSVIPSREG